MSQNGPLDQRSYDLKLESVLRQRLRFLYADFPC
jgi:hypothetical protein